MKKLLILFLFAGLAACTAAPTAPSRNNSFSDGGSNDVSTAAVETVASTAVEATAGAENPDAGEPATVASIDLQPPTDAAQEVAAAEGLNPIAGVATGDDAKALSELGATTDENGSVTVHEADMTGSDPGGL